MRLRLNKLKDHRCLEIGAGDNVIRGFERLDICWHSKIDYVLDAHQRLPFEEGAFDVVYASHVLEHIPWYRVEKTLSEWVRILKPGGRLEIWVPDGLKICRTIIAAEENAIGDVPDGWCVNNRERDPFVWAAGRLFWGANPSYPSWHRALFTPTYLKHLFARVGLQGVRELTHEEVRGYDHGWINLGVVGTKP